MRYALFPLCACLAVAADGQLPLPKAPLVVVIPDVKAADAALSGAYRKFLQGKPEPTDTLVSAWRRTQVGYKLEHQWSKFAESLPLTWDELMKLQPRSMGLSLLDVGNLEAVLVVDTLLAQLPLQLPEGEPRQHGGVRYASVTPGAGDQSEDASRRMGLAWARKGSRLFLATSERALKLALDEAQANRGVRPPLPGIISMDLDLEALRKDRYFQREFPFEEGPETGHLRTDLRLEDGQFVEVREGITEPRNAVPTFQVTAATSGWEPDGKGFWKAFRRGLLEPIPAPADRPVPTLRSLPPAERGAAEDRYAVDFTRPKFTSTAEAFEKGDLEAWSTLLTQIPIPGWGWWVGHDGTRRLVFPWPENKDAAFLQACRTTLTRRAGRASVAKVGEATELRVGPELPALAIRRTGAYLWVGPTAASVKDAPTPQLDGSLVRWAHLDLEATRKESTRWIKIEGPALPEQMRPFADRVLGLLGWMPATKGLRVERRKTAQGWQERVVLTTR